MVKFFSSTTNLQQGMRVLTTAEYKTTKVIKSTTLALTRQMWTGKKWVTIFQEQSIKRTKTMTGAMMDFGRGLTKVGRTLTFTGFIMSAVWRRVSRGIRSLMGVVKGLINEFKDFDKVSDWLGETLKRLALGGRLNEESMFAVMGVWQQSMEVSMALGAELALLETTFKDLKIGAAEETTEFVSQVNELLGTLDLDTVKQGIKDMASAFYDNLLTSIKKIVEDDKYISLVEDLKWIGGLAGSFLGGILEGAASLITDLADIAEAFSGVTGEDEEGDEGLKGLANWLGKVMVKMGALSVPLILVGGVTGPLGTAISAITGLIGGGPIGALVGLSLAAAIAGIMLDFESWQEWAKDLADTLDLDLAVVLEDVEDFIIGMGKGIQIIITGIVVWITWIKKLIEWLQKLGGHREAAGLGSAGAGEQAGPGAGGLQTGGLVHRSGTYYLHSGERVVSGRGNTNMGGITINVYGGGSAEKTARAVGRQIRSLMILG